MLKEITVPEPLLKQKAKDPDGNDVDVCLDLLWYCMYYVDRAPAFSVQHRGAAGWRAGARIEQALMSNREPGQKVRLDDADQKALLDAMENPGELGEPFTNLFVPGTKEPLKIGRAGLRFVEAVKSAVDVDGDEK